MSVSYVDDPYEPMWVHKLRLRCLRLAIQSSDTEGEIGADAVIRRAEVMFSYVVAGTVPATVAELPAEVAATEPPPAP
jgi:hypothetical protein